MSSKKPWESFSHIWPTEARFITWVRGVLRKGWSGHPVKLEYLTQSRKRIVNTNPKSKKAHPTVWGWVCEQCRKEVTRVEIDHAGTVQGKFTSMDDIQGYAEHLYLVDFDSLQCVCLPCHKIRSHSQKLGISFDEASVQKEAILICSNVKDCLAFCNDYAYDVSKLTNAAKRKEAVLSILKGIK